MLILKQMKYMKAFPMEHASVFPKFPDNGLLSLRWFFLNRAKNI